jgi:opacity protein-like surface antigen
MYVLPMNRSVIALFCILLSAATASRAQVVPSATAQRFSVTVGGLGSLDQPDYAGAGIAQNSPNRMVGIGAFVDLKVNRWVQIEAKGNWLRFNRYLGASEDSYLIGPRLPLHRFGRVTPYAKALFGLGNASFLDGLAFTYAYGGGVDYRVTKRISVRAIDFEYQQWRATPAFVPYGFSAGVGYKIF